MTLFRFFCTVIVALFYQTAYAQSIKSGDYVAHLDNLNIHYSVRGTGPVMIVGHPHSGKTGYQISLKPLETLFTMVYYDPRGTGASDPPLSLDAYSYDHLIKEINDLRLHLGVKRIWLFGHSDQSALSLQYTLAYPEHVSGLILTGTKLVKSRDSLINNRLSFESQRAETDPWFRQNVEDWEYMLSHHTTLSADGRDITYAPLMWWCYSAASAAKVIPIYDSITAAGRRKAPLGSYTADELNNRNNTDLENVIKAEAAYDRITVPVLIINGAYDTNNPPHTGKALKNALKDHARLFLLDKSGHFPWVEEPDIFFSITADWFRSLPSE